MKALMMRSLIHLGCFALLIGLMLLLQWIHPIGKWVNAGIVVYGLWKACDLTGFKRM